MSFCDVGGEESQEAVLDDGQQQAGLVRHDEDGREGLELPDAAPMPEGSPRFGIDSVAHKQTYQVVWHVDIMPLPEMPLFLSPMSVGVQVTADRRYWADGSQRPEQDYCYFCYTLDGVGAFADRQGVHRVSPEECFLTEIADPGTRYFYPAADPRPWRFLAFNFRGLAARAMVREMVRQYGSIYRLGSQSSIILRLLAFQDSPYMMVHPHALDSAELVLELLLALAAEARAREAPDPTLGLIREALEVISRDLERDLSVAMLADRTGVSRERLSRSFQKCLHQSPQQVIREMKIRRASFLLKDTNIPIKQIATRLGYSDYTNFIRAFRQVTGMPPHEFRLYGWIALPQSFPWGRVRNADNVPPAGLPD